MNMHKDDYVAVFVNMRHVDVLPVFIYVGDKNFYEYKKLTYTQLDEFLLDNNIVDALISDVKFVYRKIH